MTSVLTRDGDTLDLVLWRALGSTAALTEQALRLNRGLADRGAVLPAGVAILLPDAQQGAPVLPAVQLWD